MILNFHDDVIQSSQTISCNILFKNVHSFGSFLFHPCQVGWDQESKKRLQLEALETATFCYRYHVQITHQRL